MDASGRYVLAGGIRHYVQESGAGPPLLLLHGGLESAGRLPDLAATLRAHRRAIEPERRGHGRTPDIPGPLTYASMADDTLALLDALHVGSGDCVGYSDGANIAMLLAIAHPERVQRLVLVSGNFHASGMTAEFRAALEAADADSYEPGLREAYARLSPDGPQHWPIVFAKVRRLWLQEPALSAADLARITSPTLVLAGDRDYVSVEHTVAMWQAIPKARLCIVPGGSQGLLNEQPLWCSQVIVEFLRGSLPAR